MAANGDDFKQQVARIIFWTRVLFVYIALVCLAGIAVLWFGLADSGLEQAELIMVTAPTALVNIGLAVAFLIPLFAQNKPWAGRYSQGLLHFSLLACYAYPFNLLLVLAWRRHKIVESYYNSTDVS